MSGKKRKLDGFINQLYRGDPAQVNRYGFTSNTFRRRNFFAIYRQNRGLALFFIQYTNELEIVGHIVSVTLTDASRIFFSIIVNKLNEEKP